MSPLQILEGAQICLKSEVIARLDGYTAMLLEWNKTHNLSGAKTEIDVYENIADSLYPLRFLPKIDSCIDIGSGAGFPAFALACALPTCFFTLVEPRKKRAAFLRYAMLNLGLKNIDVRALRVENLRLLPPSLITSRALSDTKTLLNLARHLIAPHTRILLYKGEREASEGENLGFKVFQNSKRYYLYKQGES